MNLTIKEKYKIWLFFTFFFLTNTLITYVINQTNKYILIRNPFSRDYMYIDKNIGYLIFTIIFAIFITLFTLWNNRLKYNYDKDRLYIWRFVELLWLCCLTILNIKRNLLIPFVLSDQLLITITIFASYSYFLWNTFSKMYRIIYIPLIFVKSENKIYTTFQYTYLWIVEYVLFAIIFISQMLDSVDFYFFLVLLFILDVALKNGYLYYFNLQTGQNTSLTIVRHGQTDANKSGHIQGWTDNPLNKIGFEQAKQTSKKINEIYDVYQCTPLVRTYETLDTIITEHNILPKIQLNELCIERNFGTLENVYRDPNIPNYFEKYDGYINGEKIKNFESNDDLLKRSKKVCKYIRKYYKGNNILIVSHSHFIKSLLTYVSDEDYFSYKIPNCSVSTIEFFEKETMITSTDVENY